MMMTNGGKGVVRRLLPPLTRRLSADGRSRGKERERRGGEREGETCPLSPSPTTTTSPPLSSSVTSDLSGSGVHGERS